MEDTNAGATVKMGPEKTPYESTGPHNENTGATAKVEGALASVRTPVLPRLGKVI